MTLLERGPDQGGIDAEQFEAAIEIVEAFDALTRDLGFAGSGEIIVAGSRQPLWLQKNLTARELRLVTIYVEWAPAVPRFLQLRPSVIVEWVQDERAMDEDDIAILQRATTMWVLTRLDLEQPSDRAVDVPGLAATA